MVMRIRRFEESEDYDMICQWWQTHGSFAPKPQHLSSTGLIVEADSPLCAGWLYNTDSKICIFEFVISNPKTDKNLRGRSLEMLIEEVKRISAERGYELIYTSVSSQKYIGRLVASGFIEVDKGQTHCFYEVGSE